MQKTLRKARINDHAGLHPAIISKFSRMYYIKIKPILTTILFLFLASVTFAQTGKIAGILTDDKTGETLIGVSVVLSSTGKGISTDVEGRYLLSGIAAGNHTITFSYVGYATKTITDVVVKNNEVTTVNVDLSGGDAETLGEVVVTANTNRASVSNLYANQKTNISISSGISADLIKRSPDRNTSDVLKRVSGASIQDNKFVVIRGLADRYNVATLNNAILPSSEPDRKAFAFDIIPSNMIDRVVVSKTASPDLPGDFSGGVIQIYTKDVPDQNFLSFSAGYGYNNQSTFKDFKSNERNKYDWLGFDDGTRWIPDGFPGNRSDYVSSSTQQRIAYSKTFPNSFKEVGNQARPTQNYQLTWGQSWRLKNEASIGSIIALTYRNGQQANDISRYDYESENIAYDYSDVQYRYNTTVGGLANFAYKKGKTKLALKNVFNQVFDDNYTDRGGYNEGNLIDLKLNSSELSQRSMINSQLEGDHQIGNNGILLNWNLNYAFIGRTQPDLRTIYYQSRIDSGDPYSLVDRNSRRYFSELNEMNYGGNVSVTVPFTLGDNKHNFKGGLAKLYKTRDFYGRLFQYTNASNTFDRDKLFLDKNDVFDPSNIALDGFVLNETTQSTDKYDAVSDLNAAYILLDNHFGEKVRVSWGLRVENYYQNLDAVSLDLTKVNAEREYFDFLPSLNLTYSLNDLSNIRLSASRTVSRPEFREIATFSFYDYLEQSSTSGNPDLLRSQNTNLDLRYEIYPSSGEAITASVFYKHFKNPIERVLNSASTPEIRRINFGNANSATAFGAEVEIRKNLSFISDKTWLENTTALANISYIKSDVILENQGMPARPLQGQSPYLINLGLQYLHGGGDLSFSLLYNKAGERIAMVGYQGYPDIYEKGRDVVDFQISKRIFNSKGELKLNVSDMLNQKLVFYQNLDDNQSYDSSADRIMSSAKMGYNATLTFSYQLDFIK